MLDIERLIRREIRLQDAYQADVPPCQVKLDANENPFSLPESLREAMFAEMKKIALNRYPDAGAPRLREKFATYYGVSCEMVMIGNGSDEFIQTLLIALGGTAKSILIPVPTFSMYKICALNIGFDVAEVPLDAEFDLNREAMNAAIKKEKPAVIFLSYPNNPTGNCFSRERIEAIIEEAPGIVVVDEAYGNFSGQTFLPDLKRYDNLVILKSLSKVGLAAMRLGILIGPAALVAQLDKVRLPYNLNAFSQVAAGFFIDYRDEFQRQVDEVIARREELFSALSAVEGIKVYRSDANFIFFSCALDANRIYKDLSQKGILIRNLSGAGVMTNAMRVTIGSLEENKKFIEAIKSIK
ncbi:MAG: histidinol-phosphate transaminase [Smithellaceae bacterium]|nr:histidinol-phosphate transaminase [Smithellaceae bacterium]